MSRAPIYRDLRAVPLSEAFTNNCVMTMSIGQWDAMLAAAYERGWTLLELDDSERPIRAYRKVEGPTRNPPAASPESEP
jgi:hypothetical protein